MTAPNLNLINQRFGRLFVLGAAPHRRTSSGRCIRQVLCRCDCGAERAFSTSNISSGVTLSCGCARREKTLARNHKHGGVGTTEYRIWKSMITRCENPNAKHFFRYGGRGIKICARWRNSFADFLADVGKRPSAQYSIDRYPDNDGDYEPGNVRWATASQQRLNQRRVTETAMGTQS